MNPLPFATACWQQMRSNPVVHSLPQFWIVTSVSLGVCLKATELLLWILGSQIWLRNLRGWWKRLTEMIATVGNSLAPDVAWLNRWDVARIRRQNLDDRNSGEDNLSVGSWKFLRTLLIWNFSMLIFYGLVGNKGGCHILGLFCIQKDPWLLIHSTDIAFDQRFRTPINGWRIQQRYPECQQQLLQWIYVDFE